MPMRIIAEEAKGRRLFAPPGMIPCPYHRPGAESLFAILTPRLDRAVLDLFAGSGALALEALSQGAQWAALCDSSPPPSGPSGATLSLAGFEARAQVLPGIGEAPCAGSRPALRPVFLDPPYRQTQLYGQAMEALEAAGLLARTPW